MSDVDDARRPSAPGRPTREDSTGLQTSVLEDLRSAARYRDWLVALAAPWLGDDPLEIGSGLGDYADRWATAGQRVTVSEADPERLAELRLRFAGRTDVTVRELEAPITERGHYTCVVAINVLEHVEEDVDALRSFAGLLEPGGRVVLVVPAFPSAMSTFDREIGHHRRYRVRHLRRTLTAAGMKPVQVRYINSIGLLGWYVFVKALRGRPQEGFVLSTYDRLVVPVVRAVESRMQLPFGQSVLAVAEKPRIP